MTICERWMRFFASLPMLRVDYETKKHKAALVFSICKFFFFQIDVLKREIETFIYCHDIIRHYSVYVLHDVLQNIDVDHLLLIAFVDREYIDVVHCDPEYLYWNTTGMVRATFGIFLSITLLIALITTFPQILAIYLIYGSIYYIFDWYNYLQDVNSILKNAGMVHHPHILVCLWFVGMFVFYYAMIGFFNYFCDLIETDNEIPNDNNDIPMNELPIEPPDASVHM